VFSEFQPFSIDIAAKLGVKYKYRFEGEWVKKILWRVPHVFLHQEKFCV